MKSFRLTLWFILILTLLAILIQSPLSKQLNFRRGLDLEGGTSITLLADMKDIPPNQRDSALESALTIIQIRTNSFGVSEPVIQSVKSGSDYRIIVEFPETPYEQAIKLVQPGKLEFREVNISTSSAIPYDKTLSTGMTGADLQDSQPDFDRTTGRPIVSFVVAEQSRDKFEKTTERLKGKQMAIYLDKQFISAPVVQSSIRDSGQISGNFTQEGVVEFAKILRGGALKVPVSELQHFTIGPTLGVEFLKKSLFAGVLGLLIIVFFMSILYGRLGILASIALCLYTLFVLSIFKLSSLAGPYGITLTLSGIAGFILSIGMAVDANILIFERVKEEERAGRLHETAINLGFSRAWPSIRDSNSSTLITSGILYYFGIGSVKGFALVLAIGVLVSMFSAIVVTRTLIRLLYK